MSDRFGPRLVVLAGTVLLGLGLVLASRAASQTEFQLTYGVVVGVSPRGWSRSTTGARRS